MFLIDVFTFGIAPVEEGEDDFVNDKSTLTPR